MRSRAELRRALEWVLRALLLAGLVLALWRSLAAESRARATTRTDVRGLRSALQAATRSARVAALDVAVDSMPGAVELAWAAALARGGVSVAWRGGPPALALQLERGTEPSAVTRIAVAGDSGLRVAVADSAGPLDTLRTGARGASLEAPVVVGTVRLASGRFGASAAVPDAPLPHAVLVLGRASWEARFTAAALQEAGWTVRSRQPVAPGVVVGDDGVLPIDTSRYAAVVALDSTAADLAPSVARFVAQGGGLVAAGEAANLPAFDAMAPARAGARVAGRALLDADTLLPSDLPRHVLAGVRRDAVRLQGSPSEPTAVVRRAGLGRVVTLGLDETWRWRMLGGAGGAAAHRVWWSRTVGLVAPVREVDAARSAAAAPLAELVNALGPASPAATATAPGPVRDALPLVLLALLLLALLAETASRRFRGAR